MKKENAKKRDVNSTPKTRRKVSKTMEAARRLKGSLIVLDPTFLLE